MVPGYYTLEEAAQFLAMEAEELRQIAQKNQIRSFQDRGTLRFRVQDIQELARQRGMASDPDQPLGAPPQTPHRPKSQLFPEPVVESGGQDIFDFSLEVNEDSVDIGREALPGSGARSSGSKKPGSKPKAGSDSDVRLISDQEMNLGSDSDIRLIGQDSNVNVGSSSTRRKSSLPPQAPPPTSPTKPKSALGGPASSGPPSPGKTRSKLVGNSPLPKKSSSNVPLDQDAHFLLKDSDSDVKIVGAGSDEMSMGKTHMGPTDSDIRLEGHAPPSPGSEDAMLLTEEINLDEEIRKQEEAMRQQQQKPQAKVRPKSKMPSQFAAPPPESAASPFELSDDDEATQPPKSSRTPSKAAPVDPDVDSSDFDLVPAAGDEGPVQFQGDASDDFSLELPEENIGLGAGGPGELSGPTSGINLADPNDRGISLEVNQSTPKPAQYQGEGEGESSSEFEINLEDSSGEHARIPSPESDFEVGAAVLSSAENPALEPSDSEFELTLDSSDEVPAMSEGPAEASTDDSDSEFELTLDDSGNLSAEGEAVAGGEEGDKDIFETDFEVPGLDEESSSQVGALDTDLESSDFDIQIEDESGSAVVNLDDEEPVEEEEAPAPRKTKLGKSKQPASKPGSKQQVKVKKKSADDEEEEEQQEDGEETVAPSDDDFGFGDLEGDEDFAAPDEETESAGVAAATTTPRGAVALKPAPWGVLPTLFMFPCLIVMVLLGLLSFELVQSSTGFKPPGLLTTILTKNILQVK